MLNLCRFVVLSSIIVIEATAFAQDVVLSGTVTETSLSGFTGSKFVTGGEDSTTHALFGISSRERSDNPCLVTTLKESINDSSKDTSPKKDLCGSNGATSSEINASFGDSSVHGKRVFVTGVRVVMNNDRTRVKGFQIRGKKITDAGDLVDLETGCSDTFQAGGVENRLCNITEPSDVRTNADTKDGWMKWAECSSGKLATAATLHFEAGNTPRSLVGVALKCRSVTK